MYSPSTMQWVVDMAEPSLTSTEVTTPVPDASVGSLVTRVETAETEIDTLQSDLATLQTEVDAVEDSVSGLSDIDNSIISTVNLIANGPLSVADFNNVISSAANWRAYTAVNGVLRAPASLSPTNGIVLPAVAGGRIEGLGYCEPLSPTSVLHAPSSTFIHAGTRVAQETLLTYQGQQFELSHVNLWGGTAAEIAAAAIAKCPRLLQITKGVGPGTGKALFNQVAFSYGTIGVNIGLDVNEANCDMLTFFKCFFEECDTAVKVNNLQAMDHVYRECHIRTCTIFCDVHAGGHFKVEDGAVSSPTIIYNFNPASSAGYGPNGASYIIDNLKVDSQAANSYMVKMVHHNPYYADFTSRNIHFSATAPTNPVWQISGQSRNRIYDCKNMHPGMIAWQNAGANVSRHLITGNTFYSAADVGDLIRDASCDGSCWVEGYDNFFQDGSPVDDFPAELITFS